MRFLIQNAATPYGTQFIYFHECLSRIDGVETDNVSHISDEKTLDSKLENNPDFIICHAGSLTNQIVDYCKDNDNCLLCLDIHGLSPEELEDVRSHLLMLNVFNVCYLQLLPAADLFLPVSDAKFSIKRLIIAENDCQEARDLCDVETYHKGQYGKLNSEFFDFDVNLVKLASLYHNYDEVCLVGSTQMMSGQIFLDAMIRSYKLTVKITDGGRLEDLFDKYLEPVEADSQESLILKVKKQFIEKHNCFERTAEFLEEVGELDLAEKVRKEGEKE